MVVSYNAVSGNLSIVPEQSCDPLTPGLPEKSPSCFLIFDGVALTEDRLKDWLRQCAKQVALALAFIKLGSSFCV